MKENKKSIKKKTSSQTKERRKRKKIKKEKELYEMYIDQDDTFYYIAGYTSGGTPYGITWEEMGLKPFENEEE